MIALQLVLMCKWYFKLFSLLTFNIVIFIDRSTSLFTALATSVGVNGVHSFDSLQLLKKMVENVNFRGVKFSVYQMYDPLYPKMDPVYCIGPTASYPTNWKCVLRVGNSYGVPLLNHRGMNLTYPSTCDCSPINADAKECDDFDFLAGVALFDFQSNDTSVGGSMSSFPTLFRPFVPILELFYVPPVISVLVKLHHILNIYIYILIIVH